MKTMTEKTMNMSLKAIGVAILALIGLGLIRSAHAATPVAVWDGDFSKTISGYTLNLNNNSVSDGVITINQSKGVTVDFASAMTDTGMTVMFKYSGLTLDAQKTIATSCVNSDKTGDRTGVYLYYNNKAGDPDGIWNTTGTYRDGCWAVTMTSSQLSGTFAFTYKGGSGTYLYRIADGSRSDVFTCAKLHAGGDTSIYGCAVGGTRAGSTFAAATGLKISAIAVFSGVLSENDMKSYVWPSELSKMYSNRLSTGNAVVTPGTYGAITVPNFGYKATAFTSATTLSNTASGEEITGSYANIIVKKAWTSNENDTDLSVHTIAGWFKMNALPTSSGVANAKTLFAVKSGDHDSYAGYKVAVDSAGKIYIGQCDKELWRGDQVSTTDNLVKAGEWFHLAIACSGRTDGNRNSSATFFFNGNKVSSSSTKFKTNLNGNNCTIVRIGTYGATSGLDISAAGIYVDNTALYDGSAVVNAAKGYVVVADKELTTTISQGMTFENITWQEGAFVASDRTIATITVSGAASAGEVDITFNDPTVTLKKLKLVGSRDVRLVASSALSNIASIDRTGLTGKLTYAWPVSALPMTEANIYYGAGAGSKEAHASITIAENKYLNLRGTTPFYLGTTAGESATPYAMTFKDATVHCLGWSGLAVGQATVTVEGASTVSTERVILSQGMNGLTSALVVKGTASVISTGTTDADENTNSVMFGHWNGPSTFTLQDSATFTSASQVLVGKTGNNQTINIAGGTFTAKGIKASGNASGSNTINLSGGKLVLGSVGITSYSSTTIPVNVTGNAVIEASANMTISQSVSLGSGKALTLTAPANLAMTASGVISGAGSIVKDGAGSVKLSGSNTYSGGTTINAGVLVVNSSTALGSGTVTVKEGAQLDLNGWSVTATFAGNGTICNSSTTPASVNGVRVTQGKSVSLSDGKISIHLDADETLTLTAIPNGTVTIGGSGRVEYTNATIPGLPAGLWAEDWTGTFAYSGYNDAAAGWNPTSYYNGTKSKFEFNGTITGGYFYNVPFSVGELVIPEGKSIKFTDGYTSTGGSVNNYVFAKLSGGGTFEIATTTTASPGVKFCDVSGFTGTIKNAGKDGSGYRVMLGDGDLLAVGDDPTKAAIHFTGEATLRTMTLQAENGVKMTDDVSLVFADAGSKLTVNSSVAVADGKTIPVTIEDTKGLTAGKELITWTSQPEGNFSLEVGSGAVKGTSGFQASKNSANLTAIADTSKTYYEVEGGETTTTFDNTWLETAGVKGETTEATQTALNGTNANGIKMSDVYLMGYAAAEAQNAAVILTPNQALSNGETISLSVAGVPNETRNGAVVTYKALASANRDWANPSVEEEMDTLSVDMALPTSGVLYYRVQAAVALP